MDGPIDPRDQTAYDALQAKLVPLWSSLDHFNSDDQTIVVIPSAELDVELSASELQAYEERFLFLLFLLRQPRARMVFVTGQRIPDEIVDYYLDLLGVAGSSARRRLSFVSPMEARFRPLARKVLDRPHLIDEIRSLVPNRDRAHIVPYMTGWDDRELAMRLGIPMYGADPASAHLGTKSGGRRLFRAAAVRHPRGLEDLDGRASVAAAIAALRDEDPAIGRVVVKLNEGVAGFGNVTVELGPPGRMSEDAADTALDGVDVHALIGGSDRFFELMAEEGGIVEEMVDGVEVRSPSVQLRITPLGEVELLSTHDQILGGRSGQVFVGSRFPADPAYATQISTSAAAIASELATQGVLGRFAIDYVVVRRDDGGWDDYAIELNLRKGGTTHPFLTLQFLTDGRYHAEEAAFIAPDGSPRHYVASDHVAVYGLGVMRPADLLDRALVAGHQYDPSRHVGVVFHMLSAVPTHGFVGLTYIDRSAEAAQAGYDRVVAFLAEEATAMRPTWS